MGSPRQWPKGGARRRFGLIAFALAMMPTGIGYQDLAALIARQPAVTERWRANAFASPFGTIHAATFSFPQPLGTLIPSVPGYSFASLDPRGLDLDALVEPGPHRGGRAAPQIEFPSVNRAGKGDLLAPRRPAPPESAPPADPEKTAPTAPVPEKIRPARHAPPHRALHRHAQDVAPEAATAQEAAAETAPAFPAADLRRPAVPADAQGDPQAAAVAPQFGLDDSHGADAPVAQSVMPSHEAPGAQDERLAVSRAAEAEAELTDEEPGGPDAAARTDTELENPAVTMARLYFGADTLGVPQPTLRPWREGEAPVLIPLHPSVDPDIKRTAIGPAHKSDARDAPEGTDTEAAVPGAQTVAAKGEVTGEGRRPMTPAERLGLSGASRARHERCLANAIYFESRGEPERGQMAVAQVVMNRVFSQYYPDNVCGVVYQNAHRHLACQFTFACDNVRDVVTEPDAWARATRIAADMLDGKIWLQDIGKATHYHATYVNPWWVRTMRKHKTLGIHIFYRPVRWGDGSNEPHWSPAAEIATGSIGRSAASRAGSGPAAAAAAARL